MPYIKPLLARPHPMTLKKGSVVFVLVILHLVIYMTGCTSHSFAIKWDQGSLTFSSTNDVYNSVPPDGVVLPK
jgi:hypothetical protein